ncbi:hypothetical protein N8508_00480 [bacterium]|nr:hypothetical protein [bacterium]
MGGRKNISKLIKKIVSDKNGVRRTVYVKPLKMQVHKSRNNPNWEQTKKEFAKMGVTLYGEKVLEDSYALKRLENTLKDFNAVNFFKTHKDILDNVKFQTSQDVEYNFNVSRVGEGLVQTNMENEDMIIIRNIEPKYKSATHESFHLDEYLQGKGIGKEIMKVEFEEYQKSGITKVELQANSDVGGYAWARYGFVAEVNRIEEMLHIVLDNLNPTDFANEDKIKIYDIVDRWKKDNPKENLFPVNLIATLKNKKGDEIGRTAMVNMSYPAEFDLTNKDQMKQFYKYVA